MEKPTLDYLVERAYAVLSKPAPREAIKQVIFENCKYFDQDSAGFLEKCINELEAMPGNLSKRLRYWHAQWQRNTGNEQETLACRECHGEGGFWVWRKGIRGFSPCPVCNADNMPGPQYAELRRQPGTLVMPPRYRGGTLKFELDNGLTKPGTTDYIAKIRKRLSA